ncbi:DUF2272 domain-containing protein [Dongia rigui]|uniref:DUF2272 domain-containing protein n=1 Tax=Dongia rigui TaxID=940149 RepID=A0ABU5DUX4_9PROT|nr:DUF2272 domain-containing protein [Dongia rigui]MDY0871101.1 DUF2272 domain-containing protein [Dongia rigui]
MHVFRFLPRLILTLSLAACASLPPRNLAPPADIRSNILRLADQEWQAFGRQTVYRAPDRHEIIDPVGVWEDDRKGSALVAKYWRGIGEDWTGVDGDKPWSAAFISWVMAQAGVPPEEMPASATHASYLRAAIGADDSHWRPHPPADYAPQPGDLICATRAGQKVARYDDVPLGATLHCDIVVHVGAGFLESIGGNVRNSVSKSERKLGADGRLGTNADRPWFLVLENRYP